MNTQLELKLLDEIEKLIEETKAQNCIIVGLNKQIEEDRRKIDELEMELKWLRRW